MISADGRRPGAAVRAAVGGVFSCWLSLGDDGKIVMVDASTGRRMPDRYWGQDLHRMLEMKEGLESSGARKSLASISFQRFFRRYRTLSGMSGTVAEVAAELARVYGTPLARIPRRLPSRLVRAPRRVHSDRAQLWADVTATVQALSGRGQPVLIGVRTVEEAGRGSDALTAAGVAHRVLSAAQHAAEAEIVARAGEPGTVTIATNMAGRGTDIRLGSGVADLGGLAIMLCERSGS